ncbi:MAG TPA: hypothetical protein VGQ36_27725 [Thermoanaerobaculia bacterium]|jgi:hypothetical protein|nr:hypothetical protein [Thermoanaerobaculia bacterium]
MSESETTDKRRFMWPAEYYSGPSPRAVLPRGVTFGCGAAAIAALLIVFAGGAFMASGGLVQFMDFALGMSMGDVRGMYTSEVTSAQKDELERAIEQLRAGLREGKVPVTKLDPVMQSMRKGISDRKLTPAEVNALAAAARNAADVGRASAHSKGATP